MGTEKVIAALLPWLRVILFPATSERVLAIAAEVTVPAVAPPAAEVADTYRIPLAAGAGTLMVTDPAPTPTLAIPCPENARTLLYVPEELLVVFPLADKLIVLKLTTLGPTIVMLETPLFSVMLFPATKLTLLELPFKLKFVAVGTFGPEMVMF